MSRFIEACHQVVKQLDLKLTTPAEAYDIELVLAWAVQPIDALSDGNKTQALLAVGLMLAGKNHAHKVYGRFITELLQAIDEGVRLAPLIYLNVLRLTRTRRCSSLRIGEV